jgi:hypothetical protein
MSLLLELGERLERKQQRVAALPSGVVRARHELVSLAKKMELLGHSHWANELRSCVKNNLKRRPAIKHGSVSSNPCDEGLRHQIRLFKDTNPDLTYMEIGIHFNVSTARVSEACRGFRK